MADVHKRITLPLSAEEMCGTIFGEVAYIAGFPL